MNNEFKIIIIDDNPNIHSDFIKILTAGEFEKNLNLLRNQLFFDEAQPATEDVTKMPMFEIHTANQGEEGFEKILAALDEGRPFALAFVDVRMPPGIDGIQTIKKIWEIDKNIQVVICTAYSDYNWEQTTKELGIGDNLLILKKPFDSVVVRQLACALTKKWELSKVDREYINLLEKQSGEVKLAIAQHRPISFDGVLVVSNDGVIEDYNKEFVKIWGVPKAVLESNDYELLLEHMLKKMDMVNKMITDIHSLKKDPSQTITAKVTLNDRRVIEYYTQPNKSNNKIVGRLWSFSDVTQQLHLQKEFEYQATHDNLTNLPNRLLLMDFLRYAIANAKRNKSTFAVLFFDLDKFKVINDNFSHQVGDQLLVQFAKRLGEEIRAADMFSRLGGDEFVFVIQDVKDESYITALVNRLLKIIMDPFIIANHSISITASVGVSMYPKDGTTADELLLNADIAMYSAKRDGANKLNFYKKQKKKGKS